MDNWKSLFRSHILERGLDYYASGAVTEIETTDSGYRAVVEGTEDYEVEIELKGGRIDDMYCTCPYADGGNYCKHMAAVLYGLEDRERQGDLGLAQEDASQDYKKELSGVINKIPEEEVRSILLKLALEDEKLGNNILTKYSVNISERQMIRLKKEIQAIAYKYSDRYGFVDYRNASGYMMAMETFLSGKVQDIIDKGCYMQAFELTVQVFMTIGNQDIDDSDGWTSRGADVCYEYWKQILNKCGEQDKKKIYQWFEAHQDDDTVIDYMEDYISDFLMNEFHDREQLLNMQQMLDHVIEGVTEGTDCGKWYSAHYGYENDILKRLWIMKQLECTDEEIRKYREEHRRFAAVRKLEIEEALQEGRTMDAVRILKESKELDQKSPGWVKEYSQELIELYGSLHMEDAYKEELLFQVFSCRQEKLDFVMKLKAVCEPKEWEEMREKLLQSPGSQFIKYSLLEQEKMYDRLLEEALSMGSIDILDQYEKVLKRIFPDRMRTVYAEYVKNMADTVSSRSGYQDLMRYLKKVASYPDGRQEAEQIAAEWKVLYRRRPAMMDEIEKAGF
ncbi:hypothetical protein GPL15_16865 [Clostridium sp. MCC353]|uniref:SWIM zinc finger family protein n=1 Tax=Clostridium sp. MCC353 TaxID=2592646 RepID=UPI001C0116FD|nr:SWIM zinc finger family protein [Clostridium sp. MCC353]MBT9778174.1 hypothetical protein [Clostridium sp. MCC353]